MSDQPVTTTTPSNLQIETTDLLHLLDLIKTEVKTEINCHAIGTIQTFDPATMTCMVTFNYQKVYKKANATSATPNSYTDVVVPYPVIVMGGGGSYTTYPITTGDTCLILFCDRDIDGWLESGQLTNPPASGRLHDLSDAVAIVGLSPVSKPITNYFAGVKLYYAGGYITIDKSGNINVNGGGNITLQSLLGTILLKCLNNLTIEGLQVIINPLGGNVGIGTATPLYPLDVVGNINTSAFYKGKMLGTLVVGSFNAPVVALTDGFVIAGCQWPNTITGLLNSVSIASWGGTSSGQYGSITFPVSKGSTWEVTGSGSSISWIPLGAG